MDLTTALTIKSGLKELISLGRKGYQVYKNRQKTLKFDLNLDEVNFKFQKGELRYGNLIDGKVFLSRFSHTYIPQTFMNTIATDAKHQQEFYRIGKFIRPKGGTIHINTRSFLPPLESLPHLNVEGTNSKIGFIYPVDFTGFTYQQNDPKTTKIQSNIDYFKINDCQKPIPIIFPSDSFSESECMVNIRAKIIGLPQELTNKLFNQNPLFNSVFSKIYNPYKNSEQIMCLSIIGKDLQIDKVINRQYSESKGALFIECHVNGLNEKSIDEKSFLKLLNICVPNLIDAPFNKIGYETFPGCTAFITKGDISFVFKKPNIFGIYLDSKFVKEFSEDIKKLKNYYLLFKTKLIDELGKKDINANLKLDFISDYYTQKIFDDEGVLSEQAMSIETSHLRDTVNWLRLKN